MTTSPTIRAGLVVRRSDEEDPSGLVAVCSLHNDGDEAVTISLAPLLSPSLALEVQDEQGAPVYLPPPPVPPAETPVSTLGPGEEHSVRFSGFLPSWVPPGRYRARFRYVPGGAGLRWSEQEQQSEWVGFSV